MDKQRVIVLVVDCIQDCAAVTITNPDGTSATVAHFISQDLLKSDVERPQQMFVDSIGAPAYALLWNVLRAKFGLA